jgi:3-hydroxyisobutyrate dehydrogenase
MSAYKTIGFIGLGVMGEPICRNLVKKSGAAVIAFDLAPEPLARMRAEGASVAGSVAEAVTNSDIVFLCLPSAKHARAVFEGDGILQNVRKDQIVVDLGTSSVNQTRDFAKRLQAKGASWADAPIARTRQAAQDGTLSVMVGATPELYAALEPLIRCFATDVTRCGDIGAGQVTKILNNMVLFETVNALAEAVAVAKRNGVDPALLLDTLSKGSADSFALRNHGMKAIVPSNFCGPGVLDRICLERSVLRAGTGCRCRHQDPRRRTDWADPAGSHRCGLGRGVFSGDRQAHRR